MLSGHKRKSAAADTVVLLSARVFRLLNEEHKPAVYVRIKRLTQNVRQPACLKHEVTDVRVERVCVIGPILRAISVPPGLDYAQP